MSFIIVILGSGILLYPQQGQSDVWDTSSFQAGEGSISLVSRKKHQNQGEVSQKKSFSKGRTSVGQSYKEWYLAGYGGLSFLSVSGKTTVTHPLGGTTSASHNESKMGFTLPGVRFAHKIESFYLGGEFVMNSYGESGRETLINLLGEYPMRDLSLGVTLNLSRNSNFSFNVMNPFGFFMTYKIDPQWKALGSFGFGSGSGFTVMVFGAGVGFYF
jgi:hypothetical protein